MCHVSCQEAGRVKAIDPLPFCVLVLWEFVPTLLVLVYFRHIPYTRLHRCHACELSFYQCCVQPHTGGIDGSGAGHLSPRGDDRLSSVAGDGLSGLGGSADYGSSSSTSMAGALESSLYHSGFGNGGGTVLGDEEQQHLQHGTEGGGSDRCFREDSCACCLPAVSMLPCCACLPCLGLAPVSAIASVFAASEAGAGGAGGLGNVYAGNGPLAEAAMYVEL